MKHIYCILILGLIFISSYAQPKHQEIAHYLFPEFTQGVVLMNGGEKHEYLLNYNSLTEEMIFENKGKKLAIAQKELARIDTVYIKDRKFIVLNDQFVEIIDHSISIIDRKTIVLNDQFVEFSYQSTWDLYVEYKCKVKVPGKKTGYGGTSKTTAIKSYSSFYSEGMFYHLKLPDGYETEPYTYYWLKKNEELYNFKTMKELKKLYKEKEDLFKPYVKKYGVEYGNQESIILFIEYLESN
jgi:hypothetical protein